MPGYRRQFNLSPSGTALRSLDSLAKIPALASPFIAGLASQAPDPAYVSWKKQKRKLSFSGVDYR